MSNNKNQYSCLITKAAAKGKFLDFKDGLVAAKDEDYAMLHGAGGKDHAPISVIQLCITDYSKGTGEAAVFVRASVQPHILAIVRDVCAQNLGMAKVSVKDGFGSFLSNAVVKVYASVQKCLLCGRAFAKLINGFMNACAYAITGKDKTAETVWQKFGASLKDAKAVLSQNPDMEVAIPDTPDGLVPLGVLVDYNYHQERVNVYSKTPDGLVSVSTCDIMRAGRRQGGAASKLPWTVKIANFKSQPVAQQTGGTAYNPQVIQDKTEAFIMLSDQDMYRCCYAVEHYVSTWENSICIPMVRNGVLQREAARQAGGQQ